MKILSGISPDQHAQNALYLKQFKENKLHEISIQSLQALKDLDVSIYPAPISPAGEKKHVQSEDKCYVCI